MTKSVVLCRPLGVHHNDVVGVFKPPREGLGTSTEIEPFVVGQRMDGLGPNRMQWVALRTGDRDTEHEGLALLDGANATQNLFVGEKVQTAQLIVGAPAAPVLRCVLEQFA